MNRKILKNRNGFTLVELIVVIAIIAILAAVAIPSFTSVIKDAKKADVISAARNAYSLAKVNLLDDEINGGTAAIDEDDQKNIIEESGFDVTPDTSSMTISYTSGSLVVTVTADGWKATNTDGKIEVTP